MSNAALYRAVEASYQRVGAPRSVLVGVSGGADSVALLHLLLPLREMGVSLTCVHVNHGLREKALEEERFVQALCHRLQVPLTVKRVQVADRGSLEANARSARYTAFDATMQETGSDMLALAHHMEDQAETVLIRLLHGAGSQGLSAMREINGTIWRPLLGVTKQALMDYLSVEGIGYCEDESNRDVRHLRNRIRLDVMPLLLEVAPGCVPTLARTACILGDEHSYWMEISTAWLRKNGRINPADGFVMLSAFLAAPVALQRHLVRSLCAAICITMEFAHVEQVIELAKGGMPRKINMPGNGYAYRGQDRLHIINPGIAGDRQLGMLIAADSKTDRKTECFDASVVEGAILRTRQPGDYILPLGAGGKQKLREYMINRKIDQPLRETWPLLAKGSEVLWVVGVGISQTAAIQADTTKRRCIRYQGLLPDEIDYQAK